MIRLCADTGPSHLQGVALTAALKELTCLEGNEASVIHVGK